MNNNDVVNVLEFARESLRDELLTANNFNNGKNNYILTNIVRLPNPSMVHDNIMNTIENTKIIPNVLKELQC